MNGLDGFSPREKELLLRNIAKAKPPPVLYRYRRASPWTIKELNVPEVHVASVSDMNDPFEYGAPLTVDIEKLKTAAFRHARVQLGMNEKDAFINAQSINQQSVEYLVKRWEDLRKASNLICCSSDPLSNRMWAYYAEGHKGICVGYNTNFHPFYFAREVSYRDPEEPLDLIGILTQDPTLLSDHISCRKGMEWEFEKEFRVPISSIPASHTRLLPINPDAVVEIRLGINISTNYRNEVLKVINSMRQRPRVIQMSCDHMSFKLTEVTLSPESNR